MTPDEVNAWLQAQGVASSVAGDEAPYLAQHYGADALTAAQGALGSYMQRTRSGGDRSRGGYSTDENDPAIGNAPARVDSVPAYQARMAAQLRTNPMTLGSLTGLTPGGLPIQTGIRGQIRPNTLPDWMYLSGSYTGGR